MQIPQQNPFRILMGKIHSLKEVLGDCFLVFEVGISI